MECFFGIVVLLVIFVLPAILNAKAEEKKRGNALKAMNEVKKELDADLQVKYFESTIETKNGEKLPCHKITISGTCQFPHDNYLCRVYIGLFDSTEKEGGDRYPVLCTIPDLADENGFLCNEYELKMPYKFTTFNDMPVMAFPPESMILPKRGKRRVEAYVAITPPASKRCFKDGSAFKTCTQSEYGYLESEQRSVETNRTIARIAIAVSASDGHIDRRETEVIKNYFSQQFARLEKPEKIKIEVNNALKEILAERKANTLDTTAELKKSCKTLVNAGRKSDIHAAYELAVRIIASDEEVQEAERASLKSLTELLEIPSYLAKEIQDKYFFVSMFSQGSEEALLDMPSGLSKEEKIKFLNKEYQKWRGRVNHQDEKVRTEAELRIQAITKARKKLGNE